MHAQIVGKLLLITKCSAKYNVPVNVRTHLLYLKINHIIEVILLVNS